MGGERDSSDAAERAMASARAAVASGEHVDALAAARDAILLARRERAFGAMVEALGIYREACERVIEAASRGGAGAMVVARGADAPDPLAAGCYLLQPPMIGADAARLREAATAGGLPVRVLAREPMTREGKWPVVAVGDVIVRAHVDPPERLERVEGSITKDAYKGPAPMNWFEAAIDALGREALGAIDAEEAAQHRVDDLLEIMSALPDHTGVIEALTRACEEARAQRAPTHPRRRPVVDDPYSF